MRLLIATGNAGKKREFAGLLADLPLEIVGLNDLGLPNDVEETGASFAENALLKARAYAARSGLLTLADDSGLEVDALAGAPGVQSARYGGPGLDDRGRYKLLLASLRGVPAEDRTARFRCTIALVVPDGREATVDGACEGRITDAPSGEHGFGYDPVFWVTSEGCTMAELLPERKNAISHRAVAARQALHILEGWLRPLG
ncbi:MAG: XTP/dITP diphosphatase [Chloroflexi bacterium]|nr:XTP/dITP diphosphatase [Chloroflexota bacterium]